MQAMTKKDESGDNNVPVRVDAIEERIRVNLNRFLDESGYSITMAADLAGIPQASLSRYIKGENAVPSDVLLPLAQVFGRKIEDFYDRAPPPAPKNLEEHAPVFLRSRPGFQLTEEDLSDWNRFLDQIKSRRDKKKPRR